MIFENKLRFPWNHGHLSSVKSLKGGLKVGV